MPRQTTPDQPAIDHRSAATALTYTGDAEGNPSLRGVPARNLSHADIARLVYVRTVRPCCPGLMPADEGFDAVRSVLVDELVASGIYTTPSGDQPAAPHTGSAPEEA